MTYSGRWTCKCGETFTDYELAAAHDKHNDDHKVTYTWAE